MRKLELLCVGKIKESYYRDGIAEYLKRLGRFCDASVVEIPDLADDVGAAEKESKTLLSRMDGFGRMTFPHRLMRLIAAEQLYRAFTISENVQYHK